MDSKNNIGHSADISFTAELPIPIYNGNNSMDFEKLASLYKNELLDSVLLSGLNTPKTTSMVVISPVWTVKEKCSIRISSSGCNVVRCGCSPCFTIKWKNARNGWIVPFKVVNF